MPLSPSFRNLRNTFVPGQLVQRFIIDSQFDGSDTAFLKRSLFATSHFWASNNKMVFWWVVQTHTKYVPDEPAMTHHLGRRVQNLENSIFTSGFLSLNAAIQGDYTELNTFVCNHLSICSHNPFSWEAVYCIHLLIIISWAIALPFFWEGCASIPFLCFSSLADQIKYSETPKYSEQ